MVDGGREHRVSLGGMRVEDYLSRLADKVPAGRGLPRRDAGHVNGWGHRAAMVGPVEQELLEDFRVTGHKPRAHAGNVRAFRQAGKPAGKTHDKLNSLCLNNYIILPCIKYL